MKRSFEPKEFVCADCGCKFINASAKKMYCVDCAAKRVEKTKRDWYIRNNPNAYSPLEQHFCVACGEHAVSSFNGEWYCNKHWLRMYNNGTLEKKAHKINNTYEFHEDHVVVVTAKGDRILVDNCDFDLVKTHSWCIRAAGYAVSRINDKIANMHRFIMDAPKGFCVDHINGNKLDNRRSNLRVCTHRENCKNHVVSSPYGVSGVRRINNRFRAGIEVDWKGIYLGTFDTLEEAVNARKRAETKYYGEFAPSVCRSNL